MSDNCFHLDLTTRISHVIQSPAMIKWCQHIFFVKIVSRISLPYKVHFEALNDIKSRGFF